jgi:hypothetical protein
VIFFFFFPLCLLALVVCEVLVGKWWVSPETVDSATRLRERQVEHGGATNLKENEKLLAHFTKACVWQNYIKTRRFASITHGFHHHANKLPLPSWYSLVLSDKKFIEYITKFVKPFLLDIVLLNIFLFSKIIVLYILLYSFQYPYLFNIKIIFYPSTSSLHLSTLLKLSIILILLIFFLNSNS